jgi:signal recognition particle GTPase
MIHSSWSSVIVKGKENFSQLVVWYENEVCTNEVEFGEEMNLYKITILGTGGVGKTNTASQVLYTFLKDKFSFSVFSSLASDSWSIMIQP